MNKPIDISNVVLRTERLILRPWTLDDVDDMYEYAKVEGVGIWAGWLPHKDKEESRRIVENFIKHKKVLAIEFEGKVIGSLGIEFYRESDYPELESLKARELGYVLSKDYWGKGLMTEAVTEVIRYLFEDEFLDAITCCYYVQNDRSARVQEKCGFEFVRASVHETTFGEKRDVRCNILTREKYVGIIDFRHHINHPILGTWGGHSGYTVRPSERGHGYAKEILRQNLINARKIGITNFLITCHPWNAASEKTILANGGVFEKLVDAGDGEMLKRYWIDVLK